MIYFLFSEIFNLILVTTFVVLERLCSLAVTRDGIQGTLFQFPFDHK